MIDGWFCTRFWIRSSRCHQVALKRCCESGKKKKKSFGITFEEICWNGLSLSSRWPPAELQPEGRVGRDGVGGGEGRGGGVRVVHLSDILIRFSVSVPQTGRQRSAGTVRVWWALGEGGGGHGPTLPL